MGKRGGNSDKKKARSERRRVAHNKKREEEETSSVVEDTQPYTSRIATQQPYTSRIATQQPYTSRIVTPSSTGRYFSLNHNQSAEEGTQYQPRMVGTPPYTYGYYLADHHQYPQERNNNDTKCYCGYCYSCFQRDNSFIPNGCYSPSLY